MEVLSHELQRINLFFQGPQRIGNLGYGAIGAYFPHCKWGSRCGVGEWRKFAGHQRRWPTFSKLLCGMWGYILHPPFRKKLKCTFNAVYFDILCGQSLDWVKCSNVWRKYQQICTRDSLKKKKKKSLCSDVFSKKIDEVIARVFLSDENYQFCLFISFGN